MNNLATEQETPLLKSEIEALEFHNASIPALRKKLSTHSPSLAIVAPWWGTRGSWMAWAKMWLLNAWLEVDDIKTMFWASTSAWNTAYFVSKQLESSLPIRLELLTDNSDFLHVNAKKEFLLRLVKKRTHLILSRGNNIEDINKHFFDSENYPRILNSWEVVRHFWYNQEFDWSSESLHLDYNAFIRAKTEAIIPLRNTHSWETQYFSNKDNENGQYIETREMMFQMLQAAKTPPRIAGWPIEINWELYDDGSFADPLSLFHSLLSDDWKSIKNNVFPILLMPINIFRPINRVRRKMNKTVVNILDWEQLWSTYDIWESIYSKESLRLIRDLVQKWEMAIFYNTWKYVRKLDNSRDAIHSAYQSWRDAVRAHPFIEELVNYAKQRRS